MDSLPPPYNIVFPAFEARKRVLVSDCFGPPPSYDSLTLRDEEVEGTHGECGVLGSAVGGIFDLRRGLTSLQKDVRPLFAQQQPQLLGQHEFPVEASRRSIDERDVRLLPIVEMHKPCCCYQSSEVGPGSTPSMLFGAQHSGAVRDRLWEELNTTEKGKCEEECVQRMKVSKETQVGGDCLWGSSTEGVGALMVDIVDLLTTFYNLPPPTCWRCREVLPRSFGEELLAAALGTSSHDLLERYISLVAKRLSESVAAVESAALEGAVGTLHVVGSRNTLEALVRLPHSVLGRVLDETRFPDEILPYRLACAACELHFAGEAGGQSRSSLAFTCAGLFSHSPMVSDRFEGISVFKCACSGVDADSLLHGVRFLWLPAKFLEGELKRYEVLLPTAGNCCCATYSGFLMRLRQAAKVKNCLRSAPGLSEGPFQNSPFNDVLLSELQRLRPSYGFLTDSDKQLLLGESLNISQLRAMQEKCDASV